MIKKNRIMNTDKTSLENESQPSCLGAVSGSTDLKVVDKIDIDGFITTLEEIKYEPYAKIDFYWFLDERGEYKYNLREFITKV